VIAPIDSVMTDNPSGSPPYNLLGIVVGDYEVTNLAPGTTTHFSDPDADGLVVETLCPEMDDTDLNTALNWRLGDGGYSTVNFGGGLWKDTNGDAPDFFLFESGGNSGDDPEIQVIFPDGSVGQMVKFPDVWGPTGLIRDQAAANDAVEMDGQELMGQCWDITDMLDAEGNPLTRDTEILGFQLARSGTDPVGFFAVVPAAVARLIIWPSDGHTPAGQFADGKNIHPDLQDVNVPWDQPWVDLLEAQGYTVQREDRTLEGELSQEVVDMLNAADLVILSRDADSGKYNNPDGWNAIETPLIMLNPWSARSSRLNWFPSTSMAGFAGTPLMDVLLPEPREDVQVMDGIVGSGNGSFVKVPDAGNGTVLAVVDTNHPDATLAGSVYIAEWAAGVEFYPDANQFAGGPRAAFFAGTREGDAPDGYLYGHGMYNLTAEGEQMFLDTVASLIPAITLEPSVDLVATGDKGMILSINGIDVNDLILGTTTSPTGGIHADQTVGLNDNFDLNSDFSADDEAWVDTMFAQPVKTIFMVEKGGNDTGYIVALDANGDPVGAPVAFSPDDFGKPLKEDGSNLIVYQDQNAALVIIRADIPIYGIRILPPDDKNLGIDPVSISAIPAPMESPWTSADIGEVAVEGSSDIQDGVFTITGAGNVWDPDSFRFVYQKVEGDFEIVASLDELEPVDEWTKGGLMITATPGAKAANAYIYGSPDKGVHMQARLEEGGGPVWLGGPVAPLVTPVLLKLTKVGNVVTGNFSYDGGATWDAPRADPTATLVLDGDVYAGMAVAVTTPKEGMPTATAVFSNVAITPLGE